MNDTSRQSLKLFDDDDTTFKTVHLAYVNHLNSKKGKSHYFGKGFFYQSLSGEGIKENLKLLGLYVYFLQS
jgi:hypothetical protein